MSDNVPLNSLDFLPLKEKRKKMNLTQLEVSFLSGVPQRQISLIENNKYYPNMKTLIRILDVLEMKIKFGGKTASEIKQHKDNVKEYEWKEKK